MSTLTRGLDGIERLLKRAEKHGFEKMGIDLIKEAAPENSAAATHATQAH